MVIAGKLADRYGRKLILYIGFALLFISSICAGLVSNFYILLFFRFLQGIAIAILYTAPIAIIPELFAENTGKVLGFLYGVSGIGLTIGPFIGGYLTQIFSWHAVLFVNVPIILIAFLLCVGKIPKSKINAFEKIDIFGAILLIISLPLLIYTTINAQENG